MTSQGVAQRPFLPAAPPQLRHQTCGGVMHAVAAASGPAYRCDRSRCGLHVAPGAEVHRDLVRAYRGYRPHVCTGRGEAELLALALQELELAWVDAHGRVNLGVVRFRLR